MKCSALAALSAGSTVPRPSAQTSRRTGRKRFPRVGICINFVNFTLHLNERLSFPTRFGAIPTHFEWNRDWQPLHSSSGKPVTPGQ
jgi:hypothetical protein